MKSFSRKLTCLGMLALALACGAPPSGEEEAAPVDEVADEHALIPVALRVGSYVRTTTSLNLRGAAAVSGKLLQTMPKGAKVFVVRGPHNTSWYEVSFRGARGYAHGGYLRTGSAQTVYTLPTAEKVAALTFDAGSDRGYTASILDTLAQLGVKASFGLTGKWAEQNPDLVQRIVGEGHMVFNHTYGHRSLTGFSSGTAPLTYAERTDELWKAQSAIHRITGVSSRPYFRPPYGDFDASVLRDVSSRGYDFNFMWSVDSLGWKGLSAGAITQRVVEGLKPGAIYLFHVGAASQDGPALASIVAELRARGYRFARLSDYYSEDGALPPAPKALRYVEGGVVRGSTTEKKLSLVFTGGYHAEGAATILDALAARKVRASFFLTGAFLRLYPSVVARMVREGHYIGAHSDAHLLYASWEDRQRTLVTRQQFDADLDENLRDLSVHGPTPASMRYWIPPYEWYNAQISEWSGQRGMVLLSFTPGSGSEYDWRPDSHPNFISSKAIYESILTYESTQPDGLKGFLLMLHLGTGAERTDKFHPYFPALLDTLLARGYAFERVDALLAP